MRQGHGMGEVVFSSENADRTSQHGSNCVENAVFICDRCLQRGPLHYRVSSSAQSGWHFVCPDCWPGVKDEPGYRYGGTRKANRRDRKR